MLTNTDTPLDYFGNLLTALSKGEALPVSDQPVGDSRKVEAHLRAVRLFRAYHYDRKTYQELADEEDVCAPRIRQLIYPIEEMFVKRADELIRENLFHYKWFNRGTDGVNYLTPRDIEPDGTIRVVLTIFDREDSNGSFRPAPSTTFKHWVKNRPEYEAVFGEYDPRCLLTKAMCQNDLTRSVNYRRATFQVKRFSVTDGYILGNKEDPKCVLCASILPNGPMADEIIRRLKGGVPLIFRMRALERRGPPIHDENYDVITWDLVD